MTTGNGHRNIYLVTRRDSQDKYLVRAPLRTSALRHIASTEYEAHVATQDELVQWLPTHEVQDVEASP